jgi:hypothetical protein
LILGIAEANGALVFAGEKRERADIEDKIRAKEAAKSFDQQFIELARSVYINNDKRGDLKRQINALLNSDFAEEKQYTSYSS